MIDVETLRRQVEDVSHHSLSDIRQDIMALAVSKFKTNGYFVEFGALDGVKGSNTLLLEREYEWNGLLVEPARYWAESIIANRRCKFDFRAVAAETGHILMFKETNTHLGLSGLVDYFNIKDMHANTRATSAGDVYEVETVSLTDLLDQYDAPEYIDYISVDTEGSERAILEKFNFSRKVGLWTIEHNFENTSREAIHDIMRRNGYVRVLEGLSYIDDWYIFNA